MKRCLFGLLWLFLLGSTFCFADVVINEIHYNPLDGYMTAGTLREFIELYNPGPEAVDLSGYQFVRGLTFTFPDGSRLGAGSYLVVARDPNQSTWRNQRFPIYGPYVGQLANGGETISLERPDGTLADSVKYNDEPLWPRAPDGYGPSLEKIAYDLPADDYHSWRSSLQDNGTPGRTNSARMIPSRPMVQSVEIDPPHPTSSDSVTVRLTLDAPSQIESVTLLWERAGDANVSNAHGTTTMERIVETADRAIYKGVLPVQNSQTLIRCVASVRLNGGQSVQLPQSIEPNPFISYFVYDGEINSKLPLLWLLYSTSSSILGYSRQVSGVVCLKPEDHYPQVFDGAKVEKTHNGYKGRFVKGAEFYGDRTINIIPEIPAGGTNSGVSAPFCEHLGFWYFRELGVPSPWVEFFRVVTLPRSRGIAHTQQLVVQQVNERFLEMNGFDPNGDLYKRQYSQPNWEKHTNKDEGNDSIDALVNAISSNSEFRRREAIETYLDQEEFLAYSAASVLTSNWDGFWNNHWMYCDPQTGRWEIIPWDLDWLWGITTGAMYAEMPTTFPIDGVAVGATRASRDPGPITSPLHQDSDFYNLYLHRLRHELNYSFTEEKIFSKIEAMRSMLTQDMRLIERDTGRDMSQRLEDVPEAYADIQTFVRLRRDYLDRVLPVGVVSWELY